MNQLFHGLEYVRAHIDDLLVITKGTYEDHLEKLDTVLEKLRKANLQVNLNKFFFAKQEIEYLGYYLTPTGTRIYYICPWILWIKWIVF